MGFLATRSRALFLELVGTSARLAEPFQNRFDETKKNLRTCLAERRPMTIDSQQCRVVLEVLERESERQRTSE